MTTRPGRTGSDRPVMSAAQPPPQPPTALDRAMVPVRWTYRVAGVVLLVVMIGLPTLQVFLREVFRSPFIGAEELARFMLICVVFVTLPYVVVSGANIRMAEFTALLPAGARRVLQVVIGATAAAGFGLAALSVAVATLRNLSNATPTLGIPYWVFFSAGFLGLFFAAAESAIQAVKAAAGRDIYVTFPEDEAPEEIDLDAVLAPGAGERTP